MSWFIAAALAASYASSVGNPPGAPPRQMQAQPVLVELFTSEGCSSCPPADRLLAELDRAQPIPGAQIIALSEHVDYWNRLGWTDPFSSPIFSRRQEQYSRRFRLDSVYTPQIVVDGQAQFVGSDRAAASRAIAAAISNPKAPLTLATAARTGDTWRLRIENAAHESKKADLFIALLDTRRRVNVLAGENSGRTLDHVAVVREWVHLGQIDLAKANSFEHTFRLRGDASSSAVAILQSPGQGQVVGIAALRLPSS